MGNEAAATLARLRWSKTTKEERSEIARKLNEVRWGRRKAVKGRAKRTRAKEG